MSTNLEDKLVERVRLLPFEQQEKLMTLLDELEARAERESKLRREHDSDSRPLWERIVERSKKLPPEAFDEVPTDGSINLDHYLYGAPKKKL